MPARAPVVLVVMLVFMILVTAHWQLLDANACRKVRYPVNVELRGRSWSSTVFRLTAVSAYVSLLVYKEQS
jgi:hypothetical protein